MNRWCRILVALCLMAPLPRAARALEISEFMAVNDATLTDGHSEFSDWMEIHNPGDVAVSVAGWHLSDDAGDLTKWRFPDDTPALEAGGYLVVFASGREEESPRDPAGYLHTDFSLDGSGGYLALTGPDGRTIASEYAPAYPPQFADVSYGRAGGRNTYFQNPTPGEPNGPSSVGVPEFSRPGGLFSEPFLLELAIDEPQAEIRFTLDGSAPEANSTLYTAPIEISGSVRVRARTFAAGVDPGPIVSEAYLLLGATLREFSSNLPIVVIDSFGHDVNSESGTESNRPVFPHRPVYSVFIDAPDGGRASMTSEPDFVGRGGLKVRGNSSQVIPKKQYSFETWDEADEDTAVSLFGLPAESDWVFHAPYGDKTLMRNHLAFKWMKEIGRYAARTRLVELYFNWDDGVVDSSDYAGVYTFMEKIKRDENRVDIANLDPDDNAEPEVTGGYILKIDVPDRDERARAFQTARGTPDGYPWNAMVVSEPKDDITAEQFAWIRSHLDEFEGVLFGAEFADPETGYARYIDVESFVDYVLFTEAVKNGDGYYASVFMHKDRGGKLTMGPLWDFNVCLGNDLDWDCWNPEDWLHQQVSPFWYARLFRDPSFMDRWKGRWTELRSGVLSTARLLAEIDATAAYLDEAQERNFRRWRILGQYIPGTPHINPPGYQQRDTFEKEVDWMTDWLVRRLAWIDSRFVDPPELSLPTGRVSPGAELTLVNPNGRGGILYTVNGPDPKLESGEPAPESHTYESPITIEENLRVRARILIEGGIWSELAEASYSVGGPALALTEIMYNPPVFPEDAESRSDYEFLEFQNVGETPVELTGVRYLQTLGRQPRFDFTTSEVTALAPGEYAVLVRDAAGFRERYGEMVTVSGAYSGQLSNSGDTVILVGRVDEPLLVVTYDGEWYSEADGAGHSLVLRDPRSAPETWGKKESWRLSAEIGGSPGRADGEVGVGGRQRPGDFTQDARLGIADAIGLLRFLHDGRVSLPCGTDEGNAKLLDANGDAAVNLADAVHLLGYLFGRGAAPALGTECVRLEGCPEVCGAE